ncbi:MAG: PDGLE domain-containing protein [Streptomycetales bacterium]
MTRSRDWASRDSGSRGTRSFVLAGVVLALVLAGIVSYFASARPDGLERVARDHGIAAKQREHPASGSPFAGYQTRGVERPALSGGLAGVAGVGATFAVTALIVWVVRHRGGGPGATGAERSDPERTGPERDR